MFFGKNADKGDNPLNNPDIYNVDRENRLSIGRQSLTTGGVLKIRGFYSPVRNCIFYTGN
jgi:hypothetical protein